MRKINILFCTLSALLLFFTSYHDFDAGYIHSKYLPFYEIQSREPVTRFDIALTTHAYQNNHDHFKNAVLSFFDSVPYDGYIFFRDASGTGFDNPNPHAIFYIKNENEPALTHLSLSETITHIPTRITNDLSDKDAAITIMPFKKFDVTLRTDFSKEKIVYKPIQAFKDFAITSQDMIVSMNFILPTKDLNSFTQKLKTTLIDPNYNCKNAHEHNDTMLCNMIFSTKGKESNYSERMMSFNIFDYPFTVSKILGILSLVSSFLIMLHKGFTQSKDIALRRLHGNKESVIQIKVFSTIALESFVAFAMTLLILIIVFLDFRIPITWRYGAVLINIAIFWILSMSCVMTVIAVLLKVFAKLSAFKQPLNPKSVTWGSIILKSCLMLVLIPSLHDVVLKTHRERAFVDHYNQRPHLKEGYSASLNYGYEMKPAQRIETDIWVFKRVEHYQYDYINHNDIMHFHHDNNHSRRTLLAITLNRQALKHHVIYDVLGTPVDVASLTKNTLLIPLNAKAAYDTFGFAGDPTPIFVKETPNFTGKISGFYPVVSPPLLIVVDNPSHYVSDIHHHAIRLRDDAQAIAAFTKDIEHKLSPLELVKNEDFFQLSLDTYHKTALDLVSYFGGSLTIMTLFSILILTTTLKTNARNFAILYLNGTSKWKRYEPLLYPLIIITGGVTFAINFLSKFIKSGRNDPFFLTFALLLFMIDGCIVYITIKRFEHKALLHHLKGDY